jgi:hypothetical protein
MVREDLAKYLRLRAYALIVKQICEGRTTSTIPPVSRLSMDSDGLGNFGKVG